MSVKDWFADSVEMRIANGMIMKGTRDSILKRTQDWRNTMKSVSSRVDAFFPVKSTDKNVEWACVWGMETHTDQKGMTDSVHYQETWRFNKDGKVDFMMQYERPAKPMK